MKRRLLFNGAPQGRAVFVLLIAAILSGCNAAPTTQPLTEDQRQDQILDKMDYKPSMDHDISGGGLGDSHGLGSDINDVLNP